ncbi:hypothetical protein BS50DRAFT_98843 [Corynespora cassiicola Philippines]|uniref:Uncharacterized protein n=1 Tax=Corynespora cassiicola Philippines TaxID=1448308 RepID=A0A2T2NFE1_CORCC|nr:hypothetical protein BS50DRAFT_98843 [Corynespora cassiicola Philippines]
MQRSGTGKRGYLAGQAQSTHTHTHDAPAGDGAGDEQKKKDAMADSGAELSSSRHSPSKTDRRAPNTRRRCPSSGPPSPRIGASSPPSPPSPLQRHVTLPVLAF